MQNDSSNGLIYRICVLTTFEIRNKCEMDAKAEAMLVALDALNSIHSDCAIMGATITECYQPYDDGGISST